jgi:hypothetical protein
MKTLGQKVSRKPERAAEIDRVAEQSQEKHPTCKAVLELLQQATGLLRARIGEDKAAESQGGLTKRQPELLATAVGYGFDAMRGKSGPFSHAEMRDAVQRAFMDGWECNDEYRELTNGNSSDLRARRRGLHNGGGAKLASAMRVNLVQGMAGVAKNRRREMTEQANARKQGLAHVVQSARRGTDKDFANFKSAIETRDRLRTIGSKGTDDDIEEL